MGTDGQGATVLVVDDERAVADAYAAQLDTQYDVRKAYGGEAALETVDDAVDVVLLDRRMPDLTGDEVLDEIKDQGIDCRVVMVTAVDPDFDILDMPFEDYLRKPVGRSDLLTAIDNQLAAEEYDEQLDEFLELNTKLGLLQQEKTAKAIEEEPDVQKIQERAEELKADLDETVMQFEDSATAFKDLV